MKLPEQDNRFEDLYDHYWFNRSLAFLRSVEASIINIELIRIETLDRINALEIGVGNAVFSRALGVSFDTGIDISERQLDRAVNRNMHVKLLHVDIARDLPVNVIDTLRSNFIVVNSVLEHVEDIDKAINNIAEILMQDGYIIVTVPLLASLDVIQNDYLTEEEVLENEAISRRYLEHRNLFSKEEWENIFRSRGLDVLVSKKYLFSSSSEYIQATSFFKAVVNNRLDGENRKIIEVHKKILSSYNQSCDRPLLESELEQYDKQDHTGTCLILVLKK